MFSFGILRPKIQMSLWVTWPRSHCRQPLVAADTKAMLHVNRLLESAIHACGAISRAKVWEICGWWLSRWISYIKPQQDAIPWKPDHRSTILDIWYIIYIYICAGDCQSILWIGLRESLQKPKWAMRLGTLVAFHTKRFWIDGCSSNQNMLYCIILLYYIILYYIILYVILLYYLILYYIILYMFFYSLFYYIMILCYVMFCFLCLLYYFILYDILLFVIFCILYLIILYIVMLYLFICII